MKIVNKLRDRKGVSPVIATVILVAVAITVAVAVAYWMSGIAGQYTKFEKVEIKGYEVTTDASGNWIVLITAKNSGTATATLESIYVNQVACNISASAPTAISSEVTTDLNYTSAAQLTSGEQGAFYVWIGVNYGTLSSGTTINIKIHSASGMDYPKLVELV